MTSAANFARDATPNGASLDYCPERSNWRQTTDGMLGNRKAADSSLLAHGSSHESGSSHHMEKMLQGLGEAFFQMESKLIKHLHHLERKLDLMSEPRQQVNVYAAQTTYPAPPMAPAPAPTPTTTMASPRPVETRASAVVETSTSSQEILSKLRSSMNTVTTKTSQMSKVDEKMEENVLSSSRALGGVKKQGTDASLVGEKAKDKESKGKIAKLQSKASRAWDEGDDRREQADGKGGKTRTSLFGELNFLDKSNLEDQEYNVADFYSETGVCQWVARSDGFQNFTLLVISVNAIYIGVDADNNTETNLSKAEWYFQVCEHSFCCFFVLEWLIRFGAFHVKKNCLRDMWFKFDTALVGIMVFETWFMTTLLAGFSGIPFPTSMIKLLRLARMARMVRLTRSFPELVAMCKGVVAASRAVGSALLMMVVLVYTFAVVMFLLLKDSNDAAIRSRWGSLTISIWTLLVDGTFLDNIGLVSRALLADDEYLATAVLVMFVLASALTVMNMLIGVLCEVVTKVAEAEKDASAIRAVKENLLVVLRELDADGSGMISGEEISVMLEDSNAREVLVDLGVDVDYFQENLDMTFEKGEEVSIHAIMELILRLRGDRPVTVADLLKAVNFSDWKVQNPVNAMIDLFLTALGVQEDKNGSNGAEEMNNINSRQPVGLNASSMNTVGTMSSRR